MIDAIGIREGGGAGIVRELSHWLSLARPDWMFQLLLFPRAWRQFDDPPAHDNLVVHHVARGDSGFDRLRWIHGGVRQWLMKNPADVVLSLANIGAGTPVTPQVVYLQQMKAVQSDGLDDLSLFRRARFRFMRHWILRGARSSHAVIVQTEAMKQSLITIEPSLGARIEVIPGGVATLDRKSVLSDELRRRLCGISRPWLFFPSSLREHKNHKVLLDALPLIHARFPSTNLLLTVPDDAISKRSGVVCLGSITGGEVDMLLRESDLMVFPSRSESFGLPLVEALAADCPVVAADLPYARQTCADAAVYFDPTDPRSIAEAVCGVLSDPSLAAQMRKLGQSRSHLFQYPVIADRVATILQSAAQSRVATV